MSPEADDELKEAFNAFSGGAAEVDEAKLGTILGGMGITPTKEELDNMLERAGDGGGKIHFNGFKKMISSRSTTAKDEKELMAALTYFGVDGKIDTAKMCGALKGFNAGADDADMNRLKAEGSTLDVQEFYLKLTEV